MTQHKTKLIKFQDRRKHYRSKAKYIIEVTPEPRYLIFIGHLMTALDEQCSLNGGLIRKVEQTIINVLKTWADFSLYINLYSEIAREIGKATNQKVYVDIKRTNKGV